ncbi:MAG: OadG family protein, partial [Lachnospiraceae bacterium]|nr:OadG family protein [Lachnospiraceae bacterium]
CLLGLTACEQKKPVNSEDAERVIEYSKFIAGYMLPEDADMYNYFFGGEITSLDDFKNGGAEYTETVLSSMGLKVEGNGFLSGIDSWYKAEEDAGRFVSVGDATVEYGSKGDTLIVDVDAQFEKRDAIIEFVYKDDYNKTLTSYAVNVNYSFGEKMGKAGLNTLMGMGTVFIVLILLSLLISCFGFINKAQEAAEKKKRSEASAEEPVAEATVQAAATSSEGTDDDELAAVISAAIAAYEADRGVSVADAGGYYVRSIRRRTNNKWNRN